MLLLKTTILKLYHSFMVSPVFATLTVLVEPLRIMFANETDYLIMLTLAIIIDLIIGALKYIKLDKFSFKDLVIGLIVKVLVAYGGIALFLSFASLEDGWVAEWFLLISKFTVLLYPAGSALSNMYIVTDHKFPPISFMRKLKAFDQIITPSALTIEEVKKNEKDKP